VEIDHFKRLFDIYLFVLLAEVAGKRGWLPHKTRRKYVHVGSDRSIHAAHGLVR